MPGTGGKAGPVVPLQTAPPPSARAPSKANRRRVHILLLVVALDVSAVALAAPLIPGKMRELGVLAETVYAGSQVVGSVMLGALSDRISRSHVLLLSFSATVASYALAGLGGSVWALLAGSVLFGLFEQTRTVAAALIANLTSEWDRALGLGQLRATATLAWTLGQLAGDYLESQHPLLPAAVCVSQYALATVIVLRCLELPPPGMPPRPELPLHLLVFKEKRAKAQMYFAKAEADLVKNGLNLKTLEPGGTAQNVYMLEAIIKECNRRLEPYERPVADLAATRQPRSISQTVQQLSAEGVCRLLAAMVAMKLLDGALASLDLLDVVERYELNQNELEYLGAYKTAVMVAAPLAAGAWLIGGRLSETNMLHGAVCTLVVVHLAEAGGGPHAFRVYLYCLIPLKCSAEIFWSIAAQTLLTKALPAADTGAAFGLLALLNSASAAAAPLLGGALLALFGSGALPLAAAGAGVYACMAVAQVAILPRQAAVGASSEEHRQEAAVGASSEEHKRKDE